MSRFVLARRCIEAIATFGSSSTAAGRAAPITQYKNCRPLSTQAGKVHQTSGGVEQQQQPADPEAVHVELHQRLTQLFEEETKRCLIVPPFKRALLYGDKSAIRDHTGDYSFIQIYEAVKRLALQISNCCGKFPGRSIQLFSMFAG